MRHLFDPKRTERGATLVEYGVLMAVLVIGLIPVMNLTTDAIAGSHESAASHFATTPYSYRSGGGGEGGGGEGGGGEGTTTTTTVAPTTTTTTVAPTTTTTTLAANQTETASFGNEISVTFTEIDGEVDYESVEADGWTYVVTHDTGTYLRMKFTQSNPDHKVIVKGSLNANGVLNTAVIEKY